MVVGVELVCRSPALNCGYLTVCQLDHSTLILPSHISLGHLELTTHYEHFRKLPTQWTLELNLPWEYLGYSLTRLKLSHIFPIGLKILGNR